jgi:hypothetical protein
MPTNITPTEHHRNTPGKLLHTTLSLLAACCALLLTTSPLQAQTSHTGVVLERQTVANRTAIDVAIPVPLMNKLIAQWAARQQQDVAGKIHVELWSAMYTPLAKDPSTIAIMLQQRMNPELSIAQSTDGVAYNMLNAPKGTNYIVLVYCQPPAGATDMKIVGRPYYNGQGAASSFQHKKFVSNVKKVLNDPNITFGIYSLDGPGSTSSLNFKASSAMATGGMQTMDFLDDGVGDLGDALSGVVNAATSAVNDVQGWLKDLGDDYVKLFDQLVALIPAQNSDFFQFMKNNARDITNMIAHAPAGIIDGVVSAYKNLGNGLMGITLDGMNYILYGTTNPHRRPVNQYEYDWANAYIFNGALPPIDRLYITNLMTTDHRFVTLPMPDGTINLNLGDAQNDPIGAVRKDNGYPYPGEVFVHELSHSWQISRMGVIPTVTQGIWNTFLGLAGTDRYGYYPDCKDDWNKYNLEQQASIIDAGYLQVYNNGDFFTNGKGACHTEQGYIVSQVRAGVPLDKQASDNLFYFFQSDKYVLDNSRDPATGAAGPNGIMIPTSGNKQDGPGYYMSGHKSGTFFYYSSNAKVAAANWGPIRDKYAAATIKYSNGAFGAEHGYLGWPLNNVTVLNGGLFQHFQHGSIYWTPRYGAWVVNGRVLDAWAKSNWEKGPLGFPISDFIPNETGSKQVVSAPAGSGYQRFEKGIIRCGGLVNPAPPEIVLNGETLKDKAMIPLAAAGSGSGSGQQPGSSGKPAPGAASSINPQPLPPRVNKVTTKQPR